MNKGVCVCVAALLLFCVSLERVQANDEAITAQENVKRLVEEVNSTNFDEKVLQRSMVVVDFYVPDCPHCQKLDATIETVAEFFRDRLTFVKLNAAENPQLARKFPLKGYPTLVVVRNGRFSFYDGDKHRDVLIEKFERLLEPSVKYLENAGEGMSFLGPNNVAIYGYFESKESPEFKAYEEAADQLVLKFPFAYSDKAVVSTLFDLTQSPSIVLWKKYDEGRVVFDGTFDIDAIIRFALEGSRPLIGEATLENYIVLNAEPKPLLFLFIDDLDKRAKESAIRTFTPIAMEFRDRANFLWIDMNIRNDFALAMGLSGKVTPAIVIQTNKPFYRYAMPEDTVFDKENIRNWINAFFDGTVTPHVRSEPIPEPDDHPVRKIVGKNYLETVNDEKKDVLVKICLTVASECVSRVPVFRELGKAMKGIETVLIADLDVGNNDPPGVQLKVLPKILFYPSNQKEEPIEYNGENSVDALLTFIHANAGQPFEKPVISPGDGENDEDITEWIHEEMSKGDSDKSAAAKDNVHDEL